MSGSGTSGYRRSLVGSRDWIPCPHGWDPFGSLTTVTGVIIITGVSEEDPSDSDMFLVVQIRCFNGPVPVYKDYFLFFYSAPLLCVVLYLRHSEDRRLSGTWL